MSVEHLPETTCLVLIAHGSKNSRWTAPFQELASELKEELGNGRVHLAFMELSKPTLLEVAEDLFKNGVSSFQLLPMFIASGNHLAYDLPAQMEEVKARFPGMEVEMLPAIGQHPKFFTMIREIIKEQIR